MPWGRESAFSFTKRADTPAKKLRWKRIANRVLRESGDEGKAVRIANAALKGRRKVK